MKVEEIVWGYLPLIIAFFEMILSIAMSRKNPSLPNIVLTLLIAGLNGLAGYILIQTFLGAWPTYLPYIMVLLSSILVLIQWTLKNKKVVT